MTREEAFKKLQLMKKILSVPNSEAATMRMIEAIDMAIEALSEDKTDRPHGEWIIDTYNMELRCGVCGETFKFDDVDEVLDYMEYAKYCLACGAKMGGDTE